MATDPHDVTESSDFPSDVSNIAGSFPRESPAEFLTAREAADMLGVKLPTVYAYTSRGLIHSVPGGKGRARRYRLRDLERLCARRDARAGHGPVAAAALRQGEPVLDSSITLISVERGPIYRGHSAIDLAAEYGIRVHAWLDNAIDSWSTSPSSISIPTVGLSFDRNSSFSITWPLFGRRF